VSVDRIAVPAIGRHFVRNSRAVGSVTLLARAMAPAMHAPAGYGAMQRECGFRVFGRPAVLIAKPEITATVTTLLARRHAATVPIPANLRLPGTNKVATIRSAVTNQVIIRSAREAQRRIPSIRNRRSATTAQGELRVRIDGEGAEMRAPTALAIRPVRA